ncbi:MAG: carbohydrate ABC transporter permease [Oscillospiraceae bacterium]|nr:carbohydrate ABC transporter permease [Oscillospiraceae bacterium]
MEAKKVKFNANSTFITLLLALGSVIMLAPFLWMILTAFQTFQESMAIPIQWIPRGLFVEDGVFSLSRSLENFQEVLGRMNFLRFFANTITVAVTVTVMQLLFCSMAAYGFARIEFPGRNVIFIVLLSMMMIPTQMTLIPSFILLSNFGWINTLYALTIPHFFSVFGTFFLRQYFLTLPKDLEEAATIDGASKFRIYAQIFLPLSKAALSALGVLTVLWAWNEFMWPLVMANRESVRVLSVGIATLLGQHVTRNNWLMAASLLATTPMIIIFILFQKQFVEGIAITGIKG